MGDQKFGALSKPKRHEFFAGPDGPTPLVEFLFTQIPSRPQKYIHWLVEFGAVYVNQSRVTETQKLVSKSDVIRVHLEPKRYDVDPMDLQTRMIQETENFMVVNKPSGIPMHPTLDNLYENLISGFPQKLYVTHRLDVPTSGLVVLAKTPEFQSRFNTLVSQRGLKKIYQALTTKPVSTGPMRHFMKDTKTAPKEISLESEDGIECLLEVLSCDEITEGFESRIALITGRTHQIRAQLSATGTPLVGDEMYGGISSALFGLHAEELKFTCPVSGTFCQYKNTNTWKPLRS